MIERVVKQTRYTKQVDIWMTCWEMAQDGCDMIVRASVAPEKARHVRVVSERAR